MLVNNNNITCINLNNDGALTCKTKNQSRRLFNIIFWIKVPTQNVFKRIIQLFNDLRVL